VGSDPENKAARLAKSLLEDLLEEHSEALKTSGGACPPAALADIAAARKTFSKRVQGVSSRFEEVLAEALEPFGVTSAPPAKDRPASGPPDRLGPYRILEKIGSGATSTTYRGTHSLLSRPVAIKFLSRFGSDEEKRRFLQEGQALAKLNDPHIVAIHDCGERSGQLYLVLEFITGGSVQDLISAGEPIALELAVGITRQLLRGLAAAHDQGILHRDVKPSNLLLTDDGSLKIADFGIAKVTGMATETQDGASIGTPLYMAPEQFALPSLNGEPNDPPEVDARSDLYSAGVVLYKLLTGEVPHSEAGSLTELVVRRHGAPPPPPQVSPSGSRTA
jgi:serine/threonine protein kinase